MPYRFFRSLSGRARIVRVIPRYADDGPPDFPAVACPKVGATPFPPPNHHPSIAHPAAARLTDILEVNGDFFEFRDVRRDATNRPPSPRVQKGDRARRRRFQEPPAKSNANAQRFAGRGPAPHSALLSSHLGGFWQKWRNAPGSRPLAAEPADWHSREPPEAPVNQGYLYATDRRSM